jgi:adenine-specific DNA-methyltransferase
MGKRYLKNRLKRLPSLTGLKGCSNSADNNNIEAYRHETDKRKNAVPVGLASYDTSKPKPKKYEYAPQLVWAGKKEHTSFEVPTVSLHIHEHIAPEAIIRSIKRESPQPDLFAKPDMPLILSHGLRGVPL